jgi:hypothetical protein
VGCEVYSVLLLQKLFKRKQLQHGSSAISATVLLFCPLQCLAPIGRTSMHTRACCCTFAAAAANL